MVYTALVGVIIVLALVIVLGAGRLLLKGRWIFGWIRGMSGLLLLLLAVVLVFGALDLYSYKQLSREETVATLSFTREQPQHYKVSLVTSAGHEQQFELYGDLWQLDARLLKWNKTLTGLGLSPGYRLDRLSGRYYSLEQEKSDQRSVYELGDSKSMVDIWHWIREYGGGVAPVDASYGSATYLPMADGALFAVNLSGTGLLARPLNDRAKEAVERWQ